MVLSDWKILKQSADPEELKELEEVEKNSELNQLEFMKRDQIRIVKDGYRKPDGSKATYQKINCPCLPISVNTRKTKQGHQYPF